MFATTPASPFVATITKVPASWLNYLRAALPTLIDTVGGGTYNIGAGNTIDFPAGGGGWSYECLVSLSNAVVPSGGFLTIANGGTETIASGGQILVPAGGAINISGNSAPFANGYLNIQQYGILWVYSGGLIALNGSMSIGGTGSITLGADAGIVWGPGTSGHPAVAQFANYSTATWLNGSTLQGTGATAIFTWAGPMTISGTATVSSTGTLTVAAGGTLTTAQPAASANPGQNNITVTSITKAWGEITTGASPVVNDNLNTSATVTYPSFLASKCVAITFVQNFANNHYALDFGCPADSATPYYLKAHVVNGSKTVSGFSVVFIDSATNALWNPQSATFTFSFSATGRQ